MSEQLDLFGGGTARGVRPSRNPLLQVERPRGLYLGTSSWSFPGWAGLVYEGSHTESTLAQEGLASYARVPMFGCVSLDRSYYRPPGLQEYRRLASQVDESFRFIVKAPRDLLRMHPHRGVDAGALLGQFLEPMREGLGRTVGVVLLQYPPGCSADVGAPQRFQDHLANLLDRLPKDVTYSLELRDVDLIDQRLAHLCSEHRVGLCGSVHPHLPPVEKQLLAVPPPEGAPLMIRWNLRPSLDYKLARNRFHPFDQIQLADPSRRSRLARIVARALKAGRTVYVTANNKAEGSAPLTLRALLDEILSLHV